MIITNAHLVYFAYRKLGKGGLFDGIRRDTVSVHDLINLQTPSKPARCLAKQRALQTVKLSRRITYSRQALLDKLRDKLSRAENKRAASVYTRTIQGMERGLVWPGK